jgi:hypothetical protein
LGITTPARVRNRIQAAEAEISDDVLNEFIADEQAFIESYAGKTFLETDTQFALARSICTDRCAAKALVYLSAPSAGISYTIDELKVDKSDPVNADLSLAKSRWTYAGGKSKVPDAGTVFMYRIQDLSGAVTRKPSNLAL